MVVPASVERVSPEVGTGFTLTPTVKVGSNLAPGLVVRLFVGYSRFLMVKLCRISPEISVNGSIGKPEETLIPQAPILVPLAR